MEATSAKAQSHRLRVCVGRGSGEPSRRTHAGAPHPILGQRFVSGHALRASARLSLANRATRWLRDNLFTIGVIAALLLVVGIPLLFLLDMSFRAGTPANPGDATLINYQHVYGNPQTGSALLNTGIYAVCVSAISLAIATFFAWLIERTDMPGRNFAWVVMLLPIAIPGMLSSMAWVLLLSGKIGIINVLLRGVLSAFGVHLDTGPLEIYSFPGLIMVEGLRGSTSLFLIIVTAFRLMDPSMEEAAGMSGGSRFYTFRKVTLPLLVPSLLAAGMYALIGNLDDLEAALIIGVPAGIFLLPTLIYFTSRGGDWGLSSAYSTIFLLITIAMVVVYYRVVLRKAGQFVTITGKGYRPRRMALGRWRWPALGCFIAYFLLNIALPVFVLVWASILPSYQVPSRELLGKLTLANFTELLSRPGIVQATWNTAQFAGISATVTMLLSFLVAWLIVRQKVRGGLGLDALAFLPHAIPSVAVAIALVAFYLSPTMSWTHIYGTVIIMSLAMVTRMITFGSRTANAAMSQLSHELEEAAYASGVGRGRTLARITFRLLSPAFIAGWIFVAASAIRNLTVPLLLGGNNSGTLASTLYFYWYRNSDFSAAAALGVAMVAVLALLAIASRKLISGGYSGSD
jgi:iron(III) transport system permease protein